MKIINYEELDSTQIEAKRYAEINSACDGTIIVAKNQTKGIGTHGRKWISKPQESITFTMILKPNCSLDKLEGFTLKIAKIILKCFYDLYNISLEIKEPNDIYYNGKKVGGILTESKVYENIVKYVFIGIGLNTNQTVFDNEILDIATSIKNEFNIDVNNEEIILKIGEDIENIIF